MRQHVQEVPLSAHAIVKEPYIDSEVFAKCPTVVYLLLVSRPPISGR